MTVSEAVTKVFGGIYHVTDEALLRRIREHASIQTFEKGEIIQRSGEMMEYALFLLSGTVRCFFISGKGEELTDCFISDFGYPAMTPDVNRPVFMTSEAVDRVELLAAPLKELFRVMEEHTQMLWAYNQMLSWSLLFHWQIKTSRVCFNGPERYAWFRETFPEAEKVAYGKHIASFLGMTPESLSRIRRTQRDTDACPVMVEMKTEVSSDALLEKMKNGFEAGKMDAR